MLGLYEPGIAGSVINRERGRGGHSQGSVREMLTRERLDLFSRCRHRNTAVL